MNASELSTAGVVDAVIVVSAIAVAVLSTSPWLVLPTVALIAATAWLWRHADPRSASWVAAICWTLVGVASLLSFGLVWPVPQLIGLTIAGIVLRAQRVPWPTWLDRGRTDRAAMVLAAVSVPLTTVALVAFIASGRTDLDAATEGLQPLPLWVVLLAGIGFVLANPTVEEVLFRGALQTMIAERTNSPTAAIGIQGVAFGAIHLGGVPGGPLGMLMAAGWGVVLGIVRHRTGSIRLPWAVHVLANVAIFTTVTALALRNGTL